MEENLENVHNAAIRGDIATVMKTLRQGVDWKTSDGNAVLLSIVCMGDARLPIIELFVENGADVNANYSGKTLLRYVNDDETLCDNEQTIAYLQAKGARL